MIRICYLLTWLICIVLLPLKAQEIDGDSLDLKQIQSMIAKAESNSRPEMALASIGEADLDQGLWIVEKEKRFGGELIAFEALPKAGKVELIWTTASEYNSAYFAIERLQYNQEFAAISIIKAAGNSRSLINYFFIDDRATGPQIYRLRQVDQNGLTHYSQAIEMLAEEEQFMVLTPSEDAQNLDILTDIKMVRIRITDQKGKVVVQTEQETESFTRIDIANLKPGTYAVRVEDGDQIRMMEFKKKK
ncbi:MAG: T9SS type A sorting domain-containing protein [Bacteroidota bacterium]